MEGAFSQGVNLVQMYCAHPGGSWLTLEGPGKNHACQITFPNVHGDLGSNQPDHSGQESSNTAAWSPGTKAEVEPRACKPERRLLGEVLPPPFPPSRRQHLHQDLLWKPCYFPDSSFVLQRNTHTQKKAPTTEKNQGIKRLVRCDCPKSGLKGC